MSTLDDAAIAVFTARQKLNDVLDSTHAFEEQFTEAFDQEENPIRKFLLRREHELRRAGSIEDECVAAKNALSIALQQFASTLKEFSDWSCCTALQEFVAALTELSAWVCLSSDWQDYLKAGRCSPADLAQLRSEWSKAEDIFWKTRVMGEGET